MLGSAPGTDLLNEWVDAINDGMSLEDIANHIAASDAFTTAYPTFLTNQEFAEAFLNNLMGSEEVSAALVSAAVDIVTGLLNDGMTRGALALAAIGAMYDIHDQGEAHAAYADLGMVANGLFNKIEVAEYYTIDLRQAGSNSRVLRDVNSETGLADIMDSIGDFLDPAEPILLTNLRDNVVGTVANDRIVAEPDKNGNDTLDPFDTIDGGGGYDTLEVYTSDATVATGIDIDANHAQVSNVEHVYLSSRTGINADIAGWEGLESVELGRFGAASDVSVKVNGASVSTSRTFGGDVTIVGAAGEVSVMAGKTSAIKVGSGAHTTSVMTKGGMTVDVNASGAGGQSMTVTSVSIDGVAGEGLGGDGKRGNPMEGVDVTVATGNDALSPSTTVTQYGTNVSGTFTPVPDAEIAGNTYYKAAVQDINGDTAGTGLTDGQVVVTTDEAEAEMREQVFKDGKRVDPGTEGAVSGRDSGGVPIHINSDAIESVSLSNTYATIAVINKSDDPEDLMVTVNKYGNSDVAGKFCITGDGAAENVSIMVAGDSNFALANNATKSVSIDGDGDLTLSVTNFVGPPTNVDAGGENTPMASATLGSVTMSGGGKVTMNVAGMGKLASIDGSASSGGSSIKGVGDSVESIDGGSGADAITVAAFADDGLTVDLGAGNDTFSSAGGNGKSRIDGGDGTDVLHLTGNSATHGKGDAKASIFSNFEALEVGGSGAAAHDVKLLGVHAVSVSSSTTGTVTLNNMADGMGLSVTGKAGNDGTAANTANSLAAFTTANADGFFESTTAATDGGFGAGTANKHSVAIVVESYHRAATEAEVTAGSASDGALADYLDADGNRVADGATADSVNDSVVLFRTWVLIDANGDGDFSAADDIAIALTGTSDTAVTVATGDFMAIG